MPNSLVNRQFMDLLLFMDGSKPLAAILVSARRRQLAILDSRSRLRIFWEKFIKPLNFLTLIFSSENCLSLFFKIQINWIVHFNKFNLNDDYNWLRYVLFCYVFYTCPYTSSHKISTGQSEFYKVKHFREHSFYIKIFHFLISLIRFQISEIQFKIS